ncbi:hypothetical protein CMUS01_03621 [Colletotrichum musicola]|uniref:Uncharacterized protein n=1 Tax=Colletotrichum musicola TaxID=2175873 RepID=A0A8H6NRK1_9PEZI|nr:hypothetical protein CMUS01_03621 [Colletotrichum musicola]
MNTGKAAWAATTTHHHEAWHDGPLEGESSAFHRTFHWTLELGALDPLATKPGRSLVYTTYGARARPDPSETLPRTQLPVNDITDRFRSSRQNFPVEVESGLRCFLVRAAPSASRISTQHAARSKRSKRSTVRPG